MGAFYGNVLVARECAEVVPLLAGAARAGGVLLRGYAMPVGPLHTAIFPPEPERDAIELAGPLSVLLGAATLSAYVQDSVVLDLRVFVEGEERHRFDSCPGYGGAVGVGLACPEPVGADPDAFLPLAAGPVDRLVLGSVLRGVPLDPDDAEDGRYLFADAQHHDVMEALGLDAHRLSTGFALLARGYLPEGLPPQELRVFGSLPG
ncbi:MULTISPECIES: hypothetical protein [unclassified Streptomyces]|uniref:hypothetical protein n=1 Tax=unclassified Streptomyces TaxID=2593676 RepID=UPI0036E5E7F7